jgi:light-regulated signal transduction histidine kinase (bacteriophytochrome)
MAAGHRMQTLLDDLLILAKASTQPVDFAPTNITAIVTNALGTLGAGTDQKNARISCADLPQLPVDANQIQSLFQNLLSNALKYNRSDSPQITIDCQEAGAAYHFRVRDNGIGIAPEFQQRIFQLFQRLHTEREYPGTGMGLSLCQKIVERHGGRIWVESEPGNGSTFHFSLPK